MRTVKILVIPLLALSLGGCEFLSRIRPPVLTKTEYLRTGISTELLDPNACPDWPDKADFVSADQLDSQASEYMLKGFEAWACEKMTRAKVKEQDTRINEDVKKKNQESKPK